MKVALKIKAILNKKNPNPTLPLSLQQIKEKPSDEHTQQQNAWDYESRRVNEKPQSFLLWRGLWRSPASEQAKLHNLAPDLVLWLRLISVYCRVFWEKNSAFLRSLPSSRLSFNLAVQVSSAWLESSAPAAQQVPCMYACFRYKRCTDSCWVFKKTWSSL